MCIMISMHGLQPTRYLKPGHGDGYSVNITDYGFVGDDIICLPFMYQGQKLSELQIQLSQLEMDQALAHVTSLSPFSYLANKVSEEEEELADALSVYSIAVGRHAKNEAWYHVMGEAADVVNTWTARLCSTTEPRTYAQVFWAVVYAVAVRIARATAWADRDGACLKVGGRKDWMAQRLLADVKPVAEAVNLAAQAKSAEVRIRPHGVTQHD